MKIAITSSGKSLADKVDERFGRAKYFVIVDTNKPDKVNIIENSQNLNLQQGAGIQAAQTISNENVDALITGNCGPKAFKTLQAAGIKIFTGASGTIKEAIDDLNAGKLTEIASPNVKGHW